MQCWNSLGRRPSAIERWNKKSVAADKEIEEIFGGGHAVGVEYVVGDMPL